MNGTRRIGKRSVSKRVDVRNNVRILEFCWNKSASVPIIPGSTTFFACKSKATGKQTVPTPLPSHADSKQAA